MERPEIDQQVTFLHCADLETTDGFYRGLLGLPLAFCALPLYVLMPNLRFPDPDPNFAAQTGNG